MNTQTKPKISALTNRHFYVEGGSLMCSVTQPMVVLFSLNGDENSERFKQFYGLLAAHENRVIFSILDVSTYADIVKISRQTSTSIESAPCLYLFVNGRAIYKFKPSSDINLMKHSITQGFTQSAQRSSKSRSSQMEGIYGSQKNKEPKFKPEIGDPPSMKGYIKGLGNSPLEISNEDEKLKTPEGFVAHNEPWKIYTEKYLDNMVNDT